MYVFNDVVEYKGSPYYAEIINGQRVVKCDDNTYYIQDGIVVGLEDAKYYPRACVKRTPSNENDVIYEVKNFNNTDNSNAYVCDNIVYGYLSDNVEHTLTVEEKNSLNYKITLPKFICDNNTSGSTLNKEMILNKYDISDIVTSTVIKKGKINGYYEDNSEIIIENDLFKVNVEAYKIYTDKKVAYSNKYLGYKFQDELEYSMWDWSENKVLPNVMIYNEKGSNTNSTQDEGQLIIKPLNQISISGELIVSDIDYKVDEKQYIRKWKQDDKDNFFTLSEWEKIEDIYLDSSDGIVEERNFKVDIDDSIANVYFDIDSAQNLNIDFTEVNKKTFTTNIVTIKNTSKQTHKEYLLLRQKDNKKSYGAIELNFLNN